MAVRFRFVNGRKVPRFASSFTCVEVRPNVVPDRAFTIQELARRMQNGLPLPQLTSYQIYEDVGMRIVSQPKDLISAYNMAQEIERNNAKKEDLKREYESKLKDVSKTDLHTESDIKKD